MSAEYSADSTEEDRQEAKSYLDYLRDKTVSHDVVIGRYDMSSEQYEKSMVVINYNAPTETAATLAKLYPNNRKDVSILDVAAGTGLCAIEFQRHGFKKMDALDASKLMLEEAKKKDIYGRYICDLLGENTLDIKADAYDVVTICGMCTEIMRSLPINALVELIRVVKPGGYVINAGFHTTFEDDNVATADFRRNMRTLESHGRWQQVEIRRFKGYIHGKDGAVSVHKVC